MKHAPLIVLTIAIASIISPTTAYGATASASIMIYVEAPTSVIEIETNITATGAPTSTYYVGETMELTAIPSGSLASGESYQWKKDGVLLESETNSMLAIAELDSDNAGDYSVSIINDCGDQGNTVSLTVNVVAPLSVTITSDPETITMQEGEMELMYLELASCDEVTLTATPSGGLAPYLYQWMYEGVNIEDETGNQLVIEEMISADSGEYSVIVTDSMGRDFGIYSE